MATHVRSFGQNPSAASSGASRDRAPRFSGALGVLTTTVARILFAVPFAVFGLNHFLHGNEMAGMVPIPGGLFWIYFTGAALVAASIAILADRLGRLAALGLAAMLAGFVALIHVPGLANAATAQLSMIMLLKDVSLAGAALTYAGLLGRRGG